MTLFALCWFFAALLWKLIDNFKKWSTDKTVDHVGQWWLVVGLNVPPFIYFSSLLDLHLWQGLTLTAFTMGAVFMALFNGLYNVTRRRWFVKKRGYQVTHGNYLKWFYIAVSNSKNKSLLDGFWLMLPKWVYVLFMTVVPVALVVMYILSTSP